MPRDGCQRPSRGSRGAAGPGIWPLLCMGLAQVMAVTAWPQALGRARRCCGHGLTPVRERGKMLLRTPPSSGALQLPALSEGSELPLPPPATPRPPPPPSSPGTPAACAARPAHPRTWLGQGGPRQPLPVPAAMLTRSRRSTGRQPRCGCTGTAPRAGGGCGKGSVSGAWSRSRADLEPACSGGTEGQTDLPQLQALLPQGLQLPLVSWFPPAWATLT